jgi:hypothetical protein
MNWNRYGRDKPCHLSGPSKATKPPLLSYSCVQAVPRSEHPRNTSKMRYRLSQVARWITVNVSRQFTLLTRNTKFHQNLLSRYVTYGWTDANLMTSSGIRTRDLPVCSIVLSFCADIAWSSGWKERNVVFIEIKRNLDLNALVSLLIVSRWEWVFRKQSHFDNFEILQLSGAGASQVQDNHRGVTNIYSFCMCYEITRRMCLLEILNFSLSQVEKKTPFFPQDVVAELNCTETFWWVRVRLFNLRAHIFLSLTKWASSQLSPGGGNIFQGDIKAGMSKGHAQYTSSRNAICHGAFPTHLLTFLFVLSPHSSASQ